MIMVFSKQKKRKIEKLNVNKGLSVVFMCVILSINTSFTGEGKNISRFFFLVWFQKRNIFGNILHKKPSFLFLFVKSGVMMNNLFKFSLSFLLLLLVGSSTLNIKFFISIFLQEGRERDCCCCWMLNNNNNNQII